MEDECDFEYEDIVKNICKCASRLANKTEQNLVHQWINRLDKENYCDKARNNRNEYARYLEHMVIGRQNLHYPFVLPPPGGELKAFNQMLDTYDKKSTNTMYLPCPERCSDDKGKAVSHTTATASASIKVFQAKPPSSDTKNVSDCNREMLRKIIGELGSHMSLPQFVGLVSPHTCDRGSILRKVMGEEQVCFRDFVERMFAARNTDVGDLLAREQAALKERYEMWKQRMVNREVQCEALLREIVPDFNWDQYNNDPFYLEKFLASSKVQKMGCQSKCESNFKDWKKTMLNKLGFVRDQMREVQRENEILINQLSDLRREHHERQTMDTLNEQMQHEKNNTLYNKLRDLQQRHEDQQQKIDMLFSQIEACNCPRPSEQ